MNMVMRLRVSRLRRVRYGRRRWRREPGLQRRHKSGFSPVDSADGGPFIMPAQSIKTRSDENVIEHLLFLPPNQVVSHRVGEELAAAGLYFSEANRGLRVAVGDVDWKALLEGISEA